MVTEDRREHRGEGEPGRRVVLTIPLKAEYITLGRLALTALGNQSGLNEEKVADLKLAVSEACAGFVSWARWHSSAAGDEREPAIRIEYDLQPDRWVILVQGPGPETDPEGGRDELFSDGAISTTIIDALVDEFELLSEGESCTLRLVKRL